MHLGCEQRQRALSQGMARFSGKSVMKYQGWFPLTLLGAVASGWVLRTHHRRGFS